MKTKRRLWTDLDEQDEGARDDEEVADGQRGQVAVGRRRHRPPGQHDRRQQVADQSETADRHAGHTHQQVVEHLTRVTAGVVRRSHQTGQQHIAHLLPRRQYHTAGCRHVGGDVVAADDVVVVAREREIVDAAGDAQRQTAELELSQRLGTHFTLDSCGSPTRPMTYEPSAAP